MGNAVFSSVSICTASHKYGVPPVFLNCCSQRSVLTGSFCAVFAYAVLCRDDRFVFAVRDCDARIFARKGA